jgi:hypothetical protein
VWGEAADTGDVGEVVLVAAPNTLSRFLESFECLKLSEEYAAPAAEAVASPPQPTAAPASSKSTRKRSDDAVDCDDAEPLDRQKKPRQPAAVAVRRAAAAAVDEAALAAAAGSEPAAAPAPVPAPVPAPAPAAVPPFSEGDWQCSYCWTCNDSEHLECTKADCRLPFHKWGLLLSDEGKRSSRVRTKGKEN